MVLRTSCLWVFVSVGGLLGGELRRESEGWVSQEGEKEMGDQRALNGGLDAWGGRERKRGLECCCADLAGLESKEE